MNETPRTEAKGQEMSYVREFDAPRELVWRAWVEPQQFAVWFGGSEMKVPLDRVSLDPRPGGRWEATMVMEDGNELPFRGEYREVDEPERIVLTFEDVADENNANVEVLTVTFTDLGSRTQVVIHQAGNMPEEQYEALVEGYGSFMDALAEHLARS
jgi:uncharacterized protein YndB with AHSA1/START domain